MKSFLIKFWSTLVSLWFSSLANDRYYEGILLRSGSHLKGAQRYYRDHRSSRSNSHALHSEEAVHSNAVSNSAYRSDVDVALQHQRSGRNTIITETTTTTTTTSTLHPNARKDQNQMNAFTVEDHSETKLRLDESQTEKDRNKQEYKLNHLYGKKILCHSFCFRSLYPKILCHSFYFRSLYPVLFSFLENNLYQQLIYV